MRSRSDPAEPRDGREAHVSAAVAPIVWVTQRELRLAQVERDQRQPQQRRAATPELVAAGSSAVPVPA